MWVNETTDKVILGPDYAIVKELMKTGPIDDARALFYEKNYGKPLAEWESGKYNYEFTVLEAFAAGTNPALQFLGSFTVTITPRTTDDGEDTITVTNVVSWHSYWRFLELFGLPVPPNVFGICGDMTTIMTWTEHVAAPPWPPSPQD